MRAPLFGNLLSILRKDALSSASLAAGGVSVPEQGQTVCPDCGGKLAQGEGSELVCKACGQTVKLKKDADFEAKHPRAEGGKFTEGGQGGAARVATLDAPLTREEAKAKLKAGISLDPDYLDRAGLDMRGNDVNPKEPSAPKYRRMETVDIKSASPIVRMAAQAVGSRKKSVSIGGSYRAGDSVLTGWGGGSRTQWSYVDRGGRAKFLPLALDPNRFNDPFGQRKVLPEFPADAVAVVEHGIFAGKQATPHVYVREDVVQKTAQEIIKAFISKDADFESQHPREDGGKFAPKGGGEAAANPIEGKSNRTAEARVNTALAGFTKGIHSDRYWQPIHAAFQKLNAMGLEVNVSSAEYGGKGSNGMPAYKEWQFKIPFTNSNGRPTELWGRITAHGAGSVADPLDKYDVTAMVSAVPVKKNILKSLLGVYLRKDADFEAKHPRDNDGKFGAGGGSPSPLDANEKKIAEQTLNMPDAMAGVMGGPTKEEAAAILDNPKAKAEALSGRLNSEIDAPYVKSYVSSLGGDKNSAVMLTISLDPKESWSNGILQNSRYGNFHIAGNRVEHFSGSFGAGVPKIRNKQCKSADDVVSYLNAQIAARKDGAVGKALDLLNEEIAWASQPMNVIKAYLDAKIQKWSPQQERDDHGRWTDGNATTEPENSDHTQGQLAGATWDRAMFGGVRFARFEYRSGGGAVVIERPDVAKPMSDIYDRTLSEDMRRHPDGQKQSMRYSVTPINPNGDFCYNLGKEDLRWDKANKFLDEVGKWKKNDFEEESATTVADPMVAAQDAADKPFGGVNFHDFGGK